MCNVAMEILNWGGIFVGGWTYSSLFLGGRCQYVRFLLVFYVDKVFQTIVKIKITGRTSGAQEYEFELFQSIF